MHTLRVILFFEYCIEREREGDGGRPLIIDPYLNKSVMAMRVEKI